MNIRVHLRIRGHVQGVYYRASAQEEGERLGLTGFVRNLDNGDVEAVVEGPEQAVQQFVAWCRRGPPAARVDDVLATSEPYSGAYRRFAVAPTAPA